MLEKLQTNCNEQQTKINNWMKWWLIKLNEDKSIHVNLTNKRCRHIPIIINGKTIPYSHTAKYLGMTLDAKSRWKVHVKTKREEPGLKHKVLAHGPCQHITSWTCVDLWHTSMGMHETEQHCYNTEIPKQSTGEHRSCTLLCSECWPP